jgi:histidinol-phosphate/aromatic aminotransferase/cobyric acid decarboxylase-like protein
MRLFRSEQAARKAGVLRGHGGAERGRDNCTILTDRERALLGALEKVLPAAKENANFVWCEFPDSGARQEIADIAAAEALIKSLAVEG